MGIDIMAARELSKFRCDVKFRAGLEQLERAEKAVADGYLESYSVVYCEDDPAVVHTVFLNGKKK